jgi:uncharacterized C2H2 Zn-finger protein
MNALTKHFDVVHLKDKEFVCELCGAAFGWKVSYTRHLESHINSIDRNSQVMNVFLRTLDHYLTVESQKLVEDKKEPPSLAEELSGYGYVKERPMACPFSPCEYRAKREYDMWRHMTSHHKDEPQDLITGLARTCVTQVSLESPVSKKIRV